MSCQQWDGTGSWTQELVEDKATRFPSWSLQADQYKDCLTLAGQVIKSSGIHAKFLEAWGVVSLMFRKISWKYTIPEITFMVRISSWNFVPVPKAMLWAHVQSFSLKFSLERRFLQYANFKRISWRARETLVKQHPVSWKLARGTV